MLDSIFMKVLDMSKTGAIVIIAVIIARLLLKRAPKVISYALWAVVLLRLLCPVSFESRVSALPQMTPVSQNYALADESVSIFGAGEAAYRAVGDVLNGGIGTQRIRTTEKDETGSNVYVKTDVADVFILFGQYVWLAGVAAMALWSGVSYLKLRRKTRVCLSHDKNIFIADDIRSPFVMGIARPKIYVPSGLGEKELEYIILHEEHHIKRLDHIIKILAFAALAIHWFNPLVWLAFILAGRDMEMSCDEAVIQKLGSEVRADYSSTLLTLATGRQIIAGTPLSFGEGDPKGRIKNLSKWKKPALWAVLLAGTVGIVLAVCLLTDPKSGDNLNEHAFYLVIGEDNVHSIEISEPYSSGGIVNADGSDFKKGETVWLDLESDGSLHLLRGLMITALDEEGNEVHTITIPNDATESEIANIVLGDGWLHGPIDAAVESPKPAEPSAAPDNTASPAPDNEDNQQTAAQHVWDINSIKAPATPLDGESNPVGMVKLKDALAQYDKQQAITEGSIVTVNDSASQRKFNESIYEKFLADSALGKAGAVRKIDDNSETFGTINIRDIQFDGELYIVRRYVRDEAKEIAYEFVTTYQQVGDNLNKLFPLYSSAEDAGTDGCEVIDEFGNILYGENALLDFHNRVRNGEKALYRRVSAYSDGAYINVDSHIEFDGTYFISKTYYEPNNIVVSEIYTHMIVSPYISISDLTINHFTLLVCSENHTYADLIKQAQSAMKSGNFDDIPHFVALYNAQESLPREELDKTDWVPTDESGLSDKAQEYTVLPGSDEWNNMSMEERIASCSQSQNEVTGMTTRALIETAINYPYIINIGAYSTLDMGIEQQFYNNLALKELFTRRNAYYELIMYSIELSENDPLFKASHLRQIIDYFERNLLTEENNPWPHLVN